MGRVRAGFFHTRTQPVGLDPRPKPSLIIKRIFFARPKPASPGPAGSTGLVGPWYFRAHSVAPKKICLPDTNFLSNQTVGEKEHKKI